MNKTTTTKQDIIASAASVARDAAEGRLSPADLETQLVAEVKALVGVVVGPDDPMFGLQCDIARAVLAAHGIPAAELREWVAVQARFEGAEGPDTPAEPGSFASGPLGSIPGTS
jgi:hypothetical protein